MSTRDLETTEIDDHEERQSTTESTHTEVTLPAVDETTAPPPAAEPSSSSPEASVSANVPSRWRTIRARFTGPSSSERYCCVVPAKYWLRIRLAAVIAMMVGLFLVILFPLPGSLFFQIAIVLIVAGSLFVTMDVVRGTTANHFYGTRNVTSQRDRARGRTIEVTEIEGYGEHDNPAFTEEDRPPDYATVIATSPHLPDIVSRPPDIAINMDTIAGTSQEGRVSSPDVLPSSAREHASPSSLFSFTLQSSIATRGPPPSYDDVIKENNTHESRDAAEDNNDSADST